MKHVPNLKHELKEVSHERYQIEHVCMLLEMNQDFAYLDNHR